MLTEPEIHPQRTGRNKRYMFTPKHHGADKEAATWLPEITREQEFSVFDLADFHEICDDRGWLYGVLPMEGGLRLLGTRREQIAEFQGGNEQEAPWHGYPVYPHIKGLAPPNRSGDRCRPAKEVFHKLHSAGLITRVQRTRLSKGRHV